MFLELFVPEPGRFNESVHRLLDAEDHGAIRESVVTVLGESINDDACSVLVGDDVHGLTVGRGLCSACR